MKQVTRRVLETLRCPADWGFLYDEGDEHLPHVGELDWFFCLYSNAVSVDETHVIGDAANDFMLNSLNESDLDSVAINLETHWRSALSMYNHRVGRCHSVSFLPPSHDGKHYNAGQTRDVAISKSCSGPSLFFNDYRAESLRRAFWLWALDFYSIERLLYDQNTDDFSRYRVVVANPEKADNPVRAKGWIGLITSHALRIAFDTRQALGASRGKVSSCVCFDLNGGFGHAYPVPVDEAKAIMAPDELWTSKTPW